MYVKHCKPTYNSVTVRGRWDPAREQTRNWEQTKALALRLTPKVKVKNLQGQASRTESKTESKTRAREQATSTKEQAGLEKYKRQAVKNQWKVCQAKVPKHRG